ncbi:TolC family protein [Desulfobulbus sp.]|jgi:outer membrane protein TolC|uniref:TolC family protein n=1 Tax=Desulfobulbus sp. TaxID=895 RepID=UPI0028527B9A|nr:TolC family protein [Desulfobulbus sp.]
MLSFLPCKLIADNSEIGSSPWTVREAVRYALHHNPDAATALERIKAADADIKLARSAFYPQVSVATEYSRTNNPMYSFGNILNQGMFTNAIDFNDPGTTDNLQAKSMIQYRVYNGGHDQAALNAAGEQGRSAEFDRAAVRNRLEFEVVRAFCTIVQAEESVKARQSAHQAIDASMAVARARFKEGGLLREDVLNLEVQQARSAEQLIQARHGLQLAQRGFLHLLGRAGEEAAVDPSGYREQEIPAERTFRNRPELAAMAATVKALESRIKQAESGNWPTADVFGSYQADKGTALDEGSGNSWVTGVRMEYTLFNGGRTAAATERATARLRAAREEERKLELACSLEMEQAVLAVRQEEERLKVTGKMVDSATESARLARLRFKEGVLLASELIDTENRLIESQLSRSLATAARKIAIADLRRAAGLGQFDQRN